MTQPVFENGQYYFSSSMCTVFSKRPAEVIEMHEISGHVDSEETLPLRVENSSPMSTPLSHRKSMRKILVHRMSSLELPVDKSGLVKLHYWY